MSLLCLLCLLLISTRFLFELKRAKTFFSLEEGTIELYSPNELGFDALHSIPVFCFKSFEKDFYSSTEKNCRI
jgi:hypothetical protein